jgi:hypothetical protein
MDKLKDKKTNDLLFAKIDSFTGLLVLITAAIHTIESRIPE